MSRRLEIIALFFLIGVILLSRLPALDSFVTVDESTWLMRSANFYYALGQRDFENTVYAYHPAITTMWVGTAAMLLDFPEYRGFGQGYFEKEWQFSDFLMEHGYHPLEMLKTSRIITVGINACLFGIIYLLLRRLLGWIPAFVVVLFLAFDPFLLGHTRILAHEGMMSLLLLVSILAFVNYLYQGHQWFFLVLSAIAAGFGILTKSTATIVLPFIGLLCMIEVLKEGRKRSSLRNPNLWQQGKRLAGVWIIWFIILVITFVTFWPGMWLNPDKMLVEVYGNAFSYAIQGHQLGIVESSSNQTVNPTENDFQANAQKIIWRTTPILWIGLLFAVYIMLTKRFQGISNVKRVILIFLGFGLVFYLMMSVARGRNAAHYIMATFASLSLVAGLGITYGVAGMRQWLSGRVQILIPTIVCAGLLILQIVSAVHFYPYYFNYSNPIFKSANRGIQTPVSGYGEGLELAAEYLSKKPGSEKMTVLSWWGMGPFSYFFPGQTWTIFPSSEWPPAMVERLESSEYLVIYYYHQLRRNVPQKLLRSIADVNPEHTIWINDVEYVRIYPVSELPDFIYIPDVQEKP